MKSFIGLALLGVLLSIVSAEEKCREERKLCTDEQVSESFAPCDLKPCPEHEEKSCGAINGYLCFKEYKNPCYRNVAKCKNRAIEDVPCSGCTQADNLRKLFAFFNPFI